MRWRGSQGIRGYPTLKYWKGGEPKDGDKYAVRRGACFLVHGGRPQCVAAMADRVTARRCVRVAQSGRDYDSLKTFVTSTLE